MSIAAVIDLSNELRRLAIAGASLAPGDHRIAKLIPTLEKSGAKVPIFSKIAASAQALIDADRKTASGALLRVNALVMAVLKTQGKSTVEGEISELKKANLTGNQPISARMLEDVKTALTQSGQGRLETITNAYDRGYFGDIRLAEASIVALSEKSPEVANLAAEKLVPPYGPGVAPILAEQLDPTAKKHGARLLIALHGCDAQAAAKMARVILEGGEDFQRRFRLDEGTIASDEVRAAALECLSDSDEDEGLLLDFLKAKKKALRVAALRGLIAHGHPDAEEIVLEKLSGSPTKVREAIESLPSIRSSAILDAVERQAEGYFREIMDISLVEANTLVLLLTAVAKSEPDDTTMRLALGAMNRFGKIQKRYKKESWTGGVAVSNLERLLYQFFTKAGRQEGFEAIADQYSSSLRHPEYALAAMLSLSTPAVVWKKVGKRLVRGAGINRSVDALFQPYLVHLFTQYQIPPAKEWSKDWLMFALKHRYISMVIYLFELKPPAVAKLLLKGSKPFEGMDELLLCLASAPKKAKAIQDRGVNYSYYWYNQEESPLTQLLTALIKKKPAEAKLAAAEIRSSIYNDRLGVLLETSIRNHFS